jgi:hypothetical protein
LIKDEFKTDSNVIKAASQSMVARRKHDEKIVFTADSDAILIIAILIRTFQIKPLSLF